MIALLEGWSCKGHLLVTLGKPLCIHSSDLFGDRVSRRYNSSTQKMVLKRLLVSDTGEDTAHSLIRPFRDRVSSSYNRFTCKIVFKNDSWRQSSSSLKSSFIWAWPWKNHSLVTLGKTLLCTFIVRSPRRQISRSQYNNSFTQKMDLKSCLCRQSSWRSDDSLTQEIVLKRPLISDTCPGRQRFKSIQ